MFAIQRKTGRCAVGVSLLAGIGVALVACSSSPSVRGRSAFGDGSGALVDAGGTSPSGSGSLGPVAADVNPTPEPFKACASATATVASNDIYLAFLFDESGSMSADGSPKWASAKAASRAFFEAPESKGVHASLTFFPDQFDYACGPDAYTKPAVPMTALPSNVLGQSLDAQIPQGGTPTYSALQGAIQYAQNVAANDAQGGKVAIVLVTDGLPDSNCDGNSVQAVTALAASVAQNLPIYVIGVGAELTALNDIAKGGGTTSAFIVDTNAPQQIQQDFLAAINAIKTSAFSCDYMIPTPPNGQSLDHSKVNVVHDANQKQDTLAYNPGCSGGAGWYYDNPDAPKRIELCDDSCKTAKAEPGKLEVLFGCASEQSTVK
jgi:hypothetical protein